MSEEVEKAEAFFTYAGQQQPGEFVFIQTTAKPEQYHDLSDPDMGKRKVYDEPIFKKPIVGGVYPVKIGGGSIFYNKSATATSWYSKPGVTDKWQLLDRTTAAYIKARKNATANQYEQALAPIREAYKAAPNMIKPYLLAEIVRQITK